MLFSRGVSLKRALALPAAALLTLGGCSLGSAAPAETVTETVPVTMTAATTLLSTQTQTVRTTATATTTVTPTQTTTVTATPIMDIPGPATGPACPGAPGYVNEPPDGLDPAVRAAWTDAVALAAQDGVTLCLNDGKRSRTQQQEIYDDYLRKYGAQTADELVLPPDKSSHVTGFALDVQPAAAASWLQATAGALGFCRTYDNETWHFEYRAAYRTAGCPPRLPEPVR